MAKKVLVISDSHSNTDIVKQAIEKEIPDMLIHLGDIEDDPDGIQDCLNHTVNSHNGQPLDEYVRSIYVKGNCDHLYKSKMTKGMVFDLYGNNTLVTHGSGFYVDDSMDDLVSFAKENDLNLVMFGHTHAYMDEAIDGIRFLNPGSCAFPRKGEDPSYMVLTFDDYGTYTVEKRVIA